MGLKENIVTSIKNLTNDVSLEEEKLAVAQSLLWGRLVTYHEIVTTLKQHDLADFLEKLIMLAQKIPAVEGLPLTCQRCNNQMTSAFSDLPDTEQGETIAYCLNCLNMGRIIQGEYLYFLASPPSKPLPANTSLLTWKGQLSHEQARGASDLVTSLSDPKRPHSMIAVTGAGKTEMIFPVIQHVLLQGGRVAIASPRIDVCLELFPRLQEAFASVKMVLLYGGTDEPYSYTPLVISTTHQLLRFKEAFDLLIVDEVDAFPYAGDDSLHFAVKRAVKAQGKLVYLTATPDKTLNRAIESDEMTRTLLPARYHGYPLPEPSFYWVGDWRVCIYQRKQSSRLWQLVKRFSQLAGVKLIFLPNIDLAESMLLWLESDLRAVKVACVHSKDPLRKEKVQMVRDGEIELLLSTTILERGVTFTNCQVCILGAESRLFNAAALVQMSGRVGRKQDYPSGELIYAHQGISWAMKQAQKQILQMNIEARERGLMTR